MTTVLYTGGTGRMGQVIREGLAGRYDRVVLFARRARRASCSPARSSCSATSRSSTGSPRPPRGST